MIAHPVVFTHVSFHLSRTIAELFKGWTTPTPTYSSVSTVVAWHGSYSDRRPPTGDRDIYTGAVVKKEYLLLLFGWEFELMVGDISSVLFWNYRSPFEGITISGGGTNGGARCFLGRAINPSGELAKYFGLDRYTPRYLGRRISANEASGGGEALILIKKKFESRK